MSLPEMFLDLAVNILPVLAIAYALAGVRYLRNKQSGRVNFFSLLMFSCAIYTLAYYFEIQTTNGMLMRWVLGFKLLGATTLPAFGLMFISEYTSKKPMAKKSICVLSGFSFVLWMSFLTNPFHHLFYAKIEMVQVYFGTAVLTDKGLFYYLTLGYYCAFILFSMYLLAKAIFNNPIPHANKDKKLLIAAFEIPLIAIGLILFGFDRYLDPIPFTIIAMNALLLANAIKNDMMGNKALTYQYEELMMRMQQGLAVHDIICDEFGRPVDYRFVSVNDSFEQLTGLKRQKIVGHTVLEVLPNTEKYWIETYGKVALTGEPFKYSNYSAELGRYFEVFAYSPKPKQFAVIFSDITELKELEQALYAEKELFRTTVLAVGDAIISTDAAGKVRIMNETAEQLTGIKMSKGVGSDLDKILYLFDSESREKWIDPTAQIYDTGDPVILDNQIRLMSNNGKEIPVEGMISPITNEAGETIGSVVTFRDTTEKKKKQDEILYLSYHDQLTGLYNRRYFEEEQKRLDTERNLPMTLVMFDVNGLKLINDAFGHQTADQVLQTVAWALRKECRSDDIIARIGGDEFVLLLPKTDSQDADTIAHRIHTSIKSQTLQGIQLSVSFGWETKRDPSVDMAEIFKKAEDYMYMHKLDESKSTRHGIVEVIMKTLYEKNPAEEAHSQRVSSLAAKIGESLKLNPHQISELKTLGLMHDIGKISVREDTINKAKPLTPSEWTEIKRHSEIGYKILSSAFEYLQMAEHVLQHHEHIDGKGYPKGLVGQEISLQARIIAVADAYDAMTRPRPYRAAMSHDSAMAELRKCSGLQFDEAVVKAFEPVAMELEQHEISEGQATDKVVDRDEGREV